MSATRNLTEEAALESSSLYNGWNTSYNGSTGFHNPFSPTMDKAINGFTIIILFITMVSLGCTMQVAKIKDHIFKPKGVAIAVVAQFGIMPLTAFCLATVFKLAQIEVLTVLICGCCPGGNLSNIFSLALKGDMNLSIVMTTFSTIAALGMMPLLLFLYSHGLGSLQNAVPYTGIIIALIMTLVPCGLGITINHYKPNYSQMVIKIPAPQEHEGRKKAKLYNPCDDTAALIMTLVPHGLSITINHYKPNYSQMVIKVGLSICLVSSVAIGIMSGITIGGSVWVVLSPQIMSVAALMPLTGYTLGYVMSTIFKLNHKCRRTIAMETGCQNIQLCATILKVAFSPQVIGPLYLFPLIYIVFQGGEALVFILIFRCYEALKPQTEEKTVYQNVPGYKEEMKIP